MSLERIKQVIEKMKPANLNEAVKLSSHDVSRLMAQSSDVKAALMKNMGNFDVSTQKHQNAYNNFFKSDDTQPNVEVSDGGTQIIGDDKFDQLYTGIENQDDVVDFFNALHTAMVSVNNTQYRSHDLKVKRNGQILIELKYVTDTKFTTERGEFDFVVTPSTSGMCKIVSIDMDALLQAAQPAWNVRMLKALNSDSRAKNVLKNPINIGYTAYFK